MTEEREFWNGLFAKADPWNYWSDYEQTKYRHTLELLPDSPVGRAAELGCAEGVFTQMLAPHVEHLVATDISIAALERAQAHCKALDNVSFLQHDISEGVPGAGFDLIVCSEILYYLRDIAAVRNFGNRALESLNAGGYILMTHANMVSDDRSQTGFDFNEIGAKSICTTFCALGGFEFVRELRTDLYSVQLFRRPAGKGPPYACGTGAREVLVRRHAELEHPAIKWGGCAVTSAEARHLWFLQDVPILMYHRVAYDGPPELAPYRIAPESLERQLAWLQRHGWHNMGLEQLVSRRFGKGAPTLPGKPIVLTFDDAYADFYESAWPLLRRYGFGATVFVPVNFVGGAAEWDSKYGPPARLMTWEQLMEIKASGIGIGSHGCRHVLLKEMSATEVFEDASRSKQVLEAHLDSQINGYCYPFAYGDPASRHLIAEAGYTYAVGGRGSQSDSEDRMYLRRIEVFGRDTMDDFISKLPPPHPSDPAQRQRYLDLKARRDRATYMAR